VISKEEIYMKVDTNDQLSKVHTIGKYSSNLYAIG